MRNRSAQNDLLVQIVMGDLLIKNAGISENMMGGVIEMIKSYVDQHITKGHEMESIINMLAPAVITEILGGKWGWLAGIAASMFHLDAGGILNSIYQSVKEAVSGKSSITPSELDNAVDQGISSHQSSDAQPSNDHLSFSKQLKEAQQWKLAIQNYNKNFLSLKKSINQPLFSTAAVASPVKASILGRIIGKIFKTFFMAAGLMVAGDVGNKMLGQPNALDKTLKNNVLPPPKTTQTKYPLNPAALSDNPSQPWQVFIPNDENSIQNMLINFTKQTYNGLDGKDELIMLAPNFQAIKSQIMWYNHKSEGEPVVFIPFIYPNKKAIVDHFIDQIANADQLTPSTPIKPKTDPSNKPPVPTQKA